MSCAVAEASEIDRLCPRHHLRLTEPCKPFVIAPCCDVPREAWALGKWSFDVLAGPSGARLCGYLVFSSGSRGFRNIMRLRDS